MKGGHTFFSTPDFLQAAPHYCRIAQPDLGLRPSSCSTPLTSNPGSLTGFSLTHLELSAVPLPGPTPRSHPQPSPASAFRKGEPGKDFRVVCGEIKKG